MREPPWNEELPLIVSGQLYALPLPKSRRFLPKVDGDVPGGAVCYADQLGLKSVYESVCRFHESLGTDHWEPAPLLKQLAAQGGTFSAWKS